MSLQTWDTRNPEWPAGGRLNAAPDGRKDLAGMRLYVGNLPYQATESDLETFFAESGLAVDNIELMRDKFTGEARGFGFVEIHDQGAAEITTCDGKELLGRRLVINKARPKVAFASMDEGGGGRVRRRGGPLGGKRGRDKRLPRW